MLTLLTGAPILIIITKHFVFLLKNEGFSPFSLENQIAHIGRYQNGTGSLYKELLHQQLQTKLTTTLLNIHLKKGTEGY